MKKYIAYTKEKGKIESNNSYDFKGLTYHRLDGLAYQSFYSNDKLHIKSYWVNNIRHRLDGPAYQSFKANGQLRYEEYCINGKTYTKSEYTKEIFKMKLALI